MCGIFAFCGDAAPDPDLLQAAADAAGLRGPHGHGWVTRDPSGHLTIHHRAGPISGSRDNVRAITAPLVLGHTRLATSGDWRDPAGLQPLIRGEHAVAHNGHVHGGLTDHQGTDSGALTGAYAALRAAGMTPADALVKVTLAAQQRAWAVVVLDGDGGLWAHRRYHPLFTWRIGAGVYLSSRPAHPHAQPLPEEQAIPVGERT